MTRSQQRLLSQLATSPNELASGLGQCLEALRLISVLPRASPVFVRYTSVPSPTIKAFGRDHFSRVPLRTVISLIKTSLALSDPIHITTALFFREDGTVDPTPVLIDDDSWKELAPYIHTLHVEDDLDIRPSTARSTLSSLSGVIVGINNNGNGNGNGSVASCSGGGGSLRTPGLNSSAAAFVPLSNTITIKTSDGAMVNTAQGLCKPGLSPSSPQATSPFAILDNMGTCI